MADYYLINDQIKFYFDIEDQHIEYQGTQESLEPKEAKILKYILENHIDGLIKSETILDNNWAYWSDKKVLQKVLSTLRRKFKLIGVTENGFIAAGTEYKIKYRGVLVSDEQEQERIKKANTSKILSKVNSAAIWTFIGALSIFLLIESNEEINFKVDNIFQATALKGVSIFPSLSPDGKAIAFSHRTETDSKLYLKVESNLDYQILTEGFKDQMPAWSPSGRLIAYQRSDFPKSCEIRLIKLDEKYNQIGDSAKLFDCNPNSYHNSIAWKSEDEFYYSERQGKNTYFDIMKYSLKTKQSTPFYVHPAQEDIKVVPGHYFITFNQNNQTLYSLSSPDFFATDINKFSKDGIPSTIYQVNDTLLSISTYENTVVFKDIDNQLKAVSNNDKKQLSTIYQNPLKPISYPSISSNNNKLVLLSGSIFKDDIYAMDIVSGKSKPILSSQFRLSNPQQVNEQLYFISDRTGIRQIYSYNQVENRQITNFTKNHRIVYFTASNDYRWLAINYLDKTVLYKQETGGLVVSKTFPLMSYPAFSPDSKRLLLSTIRTAENQQTEGNRPSSIIEYDLASMAETGITVKNASFGKYHESGIVFAQPNKGIKLFTLNGTTDISPIHAVSTPLFLSVNKEFVFVTRQKDNKVFSININSKEVSDLPSIIQWQITSNDTHIFYRQEKLNNLSIFKGDLIYY